MEIVSTAIGGSVIVLKESASIQSELEVVKLFVNLIVPSFDLRDSLILSHCQLMYRAIQIVASGLWVWSASNAVT